MGRSARSAGTLGRSIARGAVVLTALVTVASCGSRTGLFGPEPPDADPDASLIDVAPRPPDARADAREDGGVDASVDAPLDAIDDGPLACVPGTFGFKLATPQLMFVLDRSGSMAFGLDSNSPPQPFAPTRWTALHNALSDTILPFTWELAMGARFYPVANANPGNAAAACSQDPGAGITPALNNAQTILDVFSATNPVGGTPTEPALALAAQQLSASRALARAMVLATDGAPNCNGNLNGLTCTCTSTAPGACTIGTEGSYNCLDDARTIATITDTFTNRKIPVYVIGIGATSTFAPVLDAMAVAGGRPRTGSPKYFSAATPAELTAAFTLVRDSVAKCAYITPSSPDDPDAISVVIGGAPVKRDTKHLDGWDWVDQAYGHIQLFGNACKTANPTNVAGTISCKSDE